MLLPTQRYPQTKVRIVWTSISLFSGQPSPPAPSHPFPFNQKLQGGSFVVGGPAADLPASVTALGGFFVHPAVATIAHTASCVQEELFGPLLYVHKFKVGGGESGCSGTC